MDKVKIKFVGSGEHILPKKGTEGSAAYDLYVPEDTIVLKGRSVIKLGFCMEMPHGYAAEIHPRSGYAAKGMEGYSVITPIIGMEMNVFTPAEATMASCQYVSLEASRFNADVIYGLVDEDYRDEIGVIIKNDDKCDFLVKKGTRIAQMLFIPVMNTEFQVTESLTETDRKGGFGSTNINQ